MAKNRDEISILENYLKENIIECANTEINRSISKQELTEFLISNENDIPSMINRIFSFGTILQIAVENGRDDLIPIFINYGADPNFRPQGRLTPLEIAMRLDNWNVVNALIPNQTSENSEELIVSYQTPLYFSSQMEYIDLSHEIERLVNATRQDLSPLPDASSLINFEASGK